MCNKRSSRSKDLYTFHLHIEYDNMVGLNEVILVRHGGIWDYAHNR
jgi:hypothetical protein